MWDLELVAHAKSHFGNPLRIQVAEWVLAHSTETPFKQSEIQDGVRPYTKSASSVPGVLELFVDSRMLMRNDTNGRVYYTFVSHPLWDAYGQVAQALRAMGGGAGGPLKVAERSKP